jgi:hypothetical protein
MAIGHTNRRKNAVAAPADIAANVASSTANGNAVNVMFG